MCCEALQWTQNQGIVTPRSEDGSSLNEIIGGIIYELTGQSRDERDVSIYLGEHRGWKRGLRPKRSDPYNLTINEKLLETAATARHVSRLTEKLGSLPTKEDSLIDQQIAAVQAAVFKLRDDYDLERVDLSSTVGLDGPSHKLNGDVHIFHDLSSFARAPECQFGLYLRKALHPHHLSLASVNHLYRIDSLPVLASSIIYDFSDDVKTFGTFHGALNLASCMSIRNVRLAFVEGHMSDSIVALSSLSNLRTLYIDLWPRDPMHIDAKAKSQYKETSRLLWPRDSTKADTEENYWGKETGQLLQTISMMNIRVVVELRWIGDCEHFERDYIGRKGWTRLVGKHDENCNMDTEEVNGTVQRKRFGRRSYEFYGDVRV